MPEPLDLEPAVFVAGDTVSWLKSLSDYPADEGWVLTYEFRGNTRKTVTATSSGADHLATITAAESAAYPPGLYYVFAYASKGEERYSIWSGEITVKANPAAGNSSFDGRSHAKKCLDAIEAALEGNMSREESSYTVNFGGTTRQLSLCSKLDLIKARNYYLQEVRREQDAARIAQGLKTGRKILLRFNR